MTYSRTDAPDIGWADLGDDADQRPQRHSGMEQHEQSDFDPAALVAGLPPRGGTAGMPSQANFDDLGERPEWHAAATPEPVAAAWQAVEAAIDAATDAERAERALDVEQGTAERVESARVRKLVAAGKPAKPSNGRDWAAEHRHLAAVAAGHRQRARQSRTTYDELVQAHKQDWAAQLVAALPSAKAEMIRALVETGRMVERLLAGAEAAQTMQRVEGGSVVALPTLAVRQCAATMQALAVEIEASDQLGGEALVRPPMTPSWAARQQIGAGIMHGVIDSGAHWLAELERREGYQLSSFTQGIPMGPKPSEDTQW